MRYRTGDIMHKVIIQVDIAELSYDKRGNVFCVMLVAEVCWARGSDKFGEITGANDK